MLVRKSNYATDSEFVEAVKQVAPVVAISLTAAVPLECDSLCRVFAPNGVEFDCDIHDMVSLADVKIGDIVVTENDRQELVVIFEYGINRKRFDAYL